MTTATYPVALAKPRTRAADLHHQPDGQWTDDDRRRSPAFVGRAVSTLNTSMSGPWQHAWADVRDGDDLPGEIPARLTSGGRVRIMRHAGRPCHRTERRASLSLRPDRLSPVFPRDSTPALTRTPAGDPNADTWHFLTGLARTVHRGWPAWR